MKNTKQQIKKEAKREILEVMPVATQFNGGKIEVGYYTKEGKEVPRECLGKKIVSTPSFFEEK